MNVTKYLKSTKVCLFYLSGFISFSNELKSPFENYNVQDFLNMEGGINSIVNKAIDFFMDEKGQLTEDGKVFKKKLDEKLVSMYGEKNPTFENVELKNLIQAAVIGFPNGARDTSSHEKVGDCIVCYQEYIEDKKKPLVVWFHGNGSSYYDWPWDKDNPKYDLLPNVLAIEYPSYVNDSCSTFEEIDKYTTAVTEFLEKYIKNIIADGSKKRIILFSHSFGCNVNTLVYAKLIDKMNYIDLRSILIFPYYNAIDASVNVLKNAKKLGVGQTEDPNVGVGNILDNFLPDFMKGGAVISGIGGSDSIIKEFVHQMYIRMFKNNKKKGYENELKYIEYVSNNADILSKCGVGLKDIRLVRLDNVDHCGWNYGIDLKSGKLIEILTGDKEFIEKDPTIPDKQDKKIIIVFSNNDDVVGKGGLLIANHFVNKHVGYNTKPLFENDSRNLKLLYRFADYDIKRDEIEFLKNDLPKYFDSTALEEIKKQGMCQCCIRIQKEEEKGIKDAAGNYIDRANNN